MAFSFTDADTSPYEPGSLFLGYSDTGRPVGIKSERHFLTIAGSGGGKGTSLIIPNILKYPHNLLVIDPGGGNARATWQARKAMGQEVHIIDPTGVSLTGDKNHPGVPERLLKSFNPLAKMNPESRTYSEDLDVIADGHVRRYDPAHATWDNNGQKIIAGVIDFLKRHFPAEDHTLIEMRRFLIGSPEELKATFEAMAKSPGATARHAASIALPDLADPNGYLGNAQANTEWLDYTSMSDILSASTFDLADLKTKPCTVFLCIDPDYMIEHGRFLRLFVRMAVSAMAKGGENGRECLFILDEFFSLGKIEYLKVVAATMRKNGVHLWPILQLASQLPDLYGPDGAQAFFGGADAHIFFNNEQDAPALRLISERLGYTQPEEIAAQPPQAVPFHKWHSILGYNRKFLEDEAKARERWQAEQENIRAAHQHAMSNAARPRVAADEIGRMTGKGPGDAIARSMIVFASGGRVFNLRLAPYFAPPPAALAPPMIAPPAALRSSGISSFLKVTGVSIAVLTVVQLSGLFDLKSVPLLLLIIGGFGLGVVLPVLQKRRG